MTPTFLSLEEVLEIHEDQLARYGGRPGLLSLALLESALAQPQTSFEGQYLMSDLFEMAAAYLFHLVQNHPFNDGNKRVGAVAAIVFLLTNGQDINLTEEELETVVLETAMGKLDRERIAILLRTHAA
ncbi:MAG: type II toxin-antitoxin system death-on-curing family toxin [Pirellulaceae bacterium]|nr:type II toxin-antitoxin system death-on-curing family toxin [Pirellulaceae bacterium]